MIVRAGLPGFLRVAAVMLAAGVALLVGGLAIIPMGIVGGGSFMFAAGGNCPGSTAASPASTAASPASTAAGPAGTVSASPGSSRGTGRNRKIARNGTTGRAGKPGHGKRAAGTPASAAATVSAAASGVPGSAPAGSATASAGAAATAGPAGTISTVAQPAASTAGRNGIPASYLALYQEMGRKYGVPWVILAGIGKVESDHGQSNLPGVHSGQNGFGAAGPMQIGIGGASGNTWGGAPVHPASEQVSGVAVDATGSGVASVYNPADAIAGAARYLLQNGVLTNVSGAIFAYNHQEAYVQAVLYWAGLYASGGYVVTTAGAVSAPQCLTTTAVTTGGAAAGQAVGTAVGYAQQQLGKPYLWGGTGPDAFDCSGLVMMAYRAAGISIPRTSQQQWAWGPHISASQAQPGDLVFFAGSDGTRASPGHVGIVIGHGLMIEAYATGFPIRIAPYTGRDPVGFTRPWSHAGVTLPGSGTQAGQSAAPSQPAQSSPPAPTGVPVPSAPASSGAPSRSGQPSPSGQLPSSTPSPTG